MSGCLTNLGLLSLTLNPAGTAKGCIGRSYRYVLGGAVLELVQSPEPSEPREHNKKDAPFEFSGPQLLWAPLSLSIYIIYVYTYMYIERGTEREQEREERERESNRVPHYCLTRLRTCVSGAECRSQTRSSHPSLYPSA